MLGKPAVEKHGDEKMPKGWKENLESRKDDKTMLCNVMRDSP